MKYVPFLRVHLLAIRVMSTISFPIAVSKLLKRDYGLRKDPYNNKTYLRRVNRRQGSETTDKKDIPLNYWKQELVKLQT